jgi:hypothetical protein
VLGHRDRVGGLERELGEVVEVRRGQWTVATDREQPVTRGSGGDGRGHERPGVCAADPGDGCLDHLDRVDQHRPTADVHLVEHRLVERHEQVTFPGREPDGVDSGPSLVVGTPQARGVRLQFLGHGPGDRLQQRWERPDQWDLLDEPLDLLGGGCRVGDPAVAFARHRTLRCPPAAAPQGARPAHSRTSTARLLGRGRAGVRWRPGGWRWRQDGRRGDDRWRVGLLVGQVDDQLQLGVVDLRRCAVRCARRL